MRWLRTGTTALLVTLAGCSAAPAAPSSAPTPASVRASVSTPSPESPSPESPSPETPSPSSTPTPPSPAPVVVLDPGHNGGNAAHPEIINAQVPDGAGGTKPCNTTGTATDAGYSEHAFTWDVALRMRDKLTAAGVRVVLTRQDDAGVGPCVDARGLLSAQVSAAAFVGIHGDGAVASGRGFHVITSSLAPAGAAVASESATLAADVRDAMTAALPVSTYTGSNGLNARGDLAGLNLNRVPAIYVECGNMRNAADATIMANTGGREQIAARLTKGVLALLGR